MKKKSITALACLALISGFHSSCIRRPSGVLSDKEMASLTADLELAEGYMAVNSISDDRTRIALTDYVIAKHGLTRAEFDTTMSWYGRNMDAYSDMLKLASKELEQRHSKLTGRQQNNNPIGDLWQGSRRIVISPLSGRNWMDFSYPAGEVGKGERLLLRMRLASNSNGIAQLGVEYSDGLMGYITRTLNNTREVKVELQTDTGHTVTRIFGNLMLSDRLTQPMRIDSISLTTQPYDSTEYYSIYGQRDFRYPTRRRTPKKEINEIEVKDTAYVTPVASGEPSEPTSFIRQRDTQPGERKPRRGFLQGPMHRKNHSD
ncbi:MAG: DUF4296 domain-containing protein [Muribaculaceae bacterium]|nr:DUF4296 domain-containing protein [Muribaculaceae bacterium]